MPKTLGTLLTDVRSRLDEGTANFFTDEEVRRWIVEGARDIARRTETLWASADIAVSANTQTYTGSADMIRIHRAEFRPTGQTTVYDLELKDINSMESVWGTSQTISRGYPAYLTMWGYPGAMSFILYPTPSVAGTLRVFYYKLPADLATNGSADSSNVDVAEGWWDALVLYCEYLALRKDRDPRWQEAKALYEERLDALAQVSRHWTDAAGSIDVGGGRHLPAWLWMEG